RLTRRTYTRALGRRDRLADRCVAAHNVGLGRQACAHFDRSGGTSAGDLRRPRAEEPAVRRWTSWHSTSNFSLVGCPKPACSSVCSFSTWAARKRLIIATNSSIP